MPTDSSHAPVVDRGADFGADIGALEAVPQHGDQHGADHDQESAIARERAEAEIDVAFEPARQRHRFRDRSVEIGEGGDRHERQADGEQHLFEIGRFVEPPIQAALEQHADRPDQDRRDRQRRDEADAERARQRDDDIAAGHGEGAMRQVHEPHQSHRHRQADGGDEQEHGVGQAVEQDADGDDWHNAARAPPRDEENAAAPVQRGGAKSIKARSRAAAAELEHLALDPSPAW